MQALRVPPAGVTDPTSATTFADVAAIMVLDRAIVERIVAPAVDPLALTPGSWAWSTTRCRAPGVPAGADRTRRCAAAAPSLASAREPPGSA